MKIISSIKQNQPSVDILGRRYYSVASSSRMLGVPRSTLEFQLDKNVYYRYVKINDRVFIPEFLIISESYKDFVTVIEVTEKKHKVCFAVWSDSRLLEAIKNFDYEICDITKKVVPTRELTKACLSRETRVKNTDLLPKSGAIREYLANEEYFVAVDYCESEGMLKYEEFCVSAISQTDHLHQYEKTVEKNEFLKFKREFLCSNSKTDMIFDAHNFFRNDGLISLF
jgi:hypothetical protein